MRTVMIAAALAMPAPASAQDAAPDPVPDVVVTAQRRIERAQTVPVAVTAIPAARIEAEAMASLDRLGAAVPNLYLQRNFGTSSGALVFLRGVGEGDSIFTNDPPVGIYVDDVIVPRSTGALFDLIDLDRIEVLRGPQGTLYGRNTSGGAIKLVTRRPSFDGAGGIADVSFGSFRRIDARATMNLPVSPDLALRVSGISRNSRGWGRNLTDGAHVNGQDVQGGRVALLWQPDARFTVFATADATLDRSGPRFPQRFVPDPARAGRFTGTFAAPEGSIDRFTSADTDPIGRTDTGGASLRVEYATGAVTLTSITGVRLLRSLIGFDQTANPPGAGANVILLQDQHQRSLSQEFQLSGKGWGDRIDWIGGLYWFDEHNDQLTAISAAVPSGTSAARYRTGDFFAAPARAGGNWSPYEPRLDTSSRSAFGSLTAAAGPRTRTTLGLRYTDEQKRYDVSFLTAPDTILVLPDGRTARRRIAGRWRDVSPRFAIDHRIGGKRGGEGEGALLYASAAKGFRSGSFDGRARNIGFVLDRQGAIAPETVWSYEAGVKFDWLGRRLRLNVDYFINDYRDIAFSAARAGIPPEIFRQNVGDARIEGVEVEWTARPFAGVELGGWVATLADRFTRLRASPGCTAFVADERDLDLRFTPALRYQLRGSVTRPLGAASLRVGGDYSAASAYSIALCNEPQHRVTDAAAINAQVALDWHDWGVMLAATNLADRRYNSGSVGTVGYPVAPREVVLRLQRRF